MTQLIRPSSRWLYVTGGTALGVAAWSLVIRRKRQRLSHQRQGKLLPTGEAHRPLGGSVLPPSVQGLLGGLNAAVSPGDSTEAASTGDAHAPGSIAGLDVRSLFNPDGPTQSSTVAESKREESRATTAVENLEPVFELQRTPHQTSDKPLGHAAKDPQDDRPKPL